LDYATYQDFTGHSESYKENTDIIDSSILKAINSIDGYEVL
jgi:hypothetical protein